MIFSAFNFIWPYSNLQAKSIGRGFGSVKFYPSNPDYFFNIDPPKVSNKCTSKECINNVPRIEFLNLVDILSKLYMQYNKIFLLI